MTHYQPDKVRKGHLPGWPSHKETCSFHTVAGLYFLHCEQKIVCKEVLHSVMKRAYLLFQNLQRHGVNLVQWSLEGRKINMSACLKYRQERDWIKADQGPVKQKWGNPHSVFSRVPPAYFLDRRKLNVKLGIICLTLSLSTVSHRGCKAPL